MRVIDVSGWIHDGMWRYAPSYPGARISECERPSFLRPEVEVYCQKFEIGGQTGTYIETEAHVRRGATPVVDYPLERFLFDAAILRLPEKGPLERITREEVLAAAGEARPGDALLLCVGWDRKWFDADFVERSPYLSREAALALFDLKPVLLGGDFPRFDNPRAPEFPWDLVFRSVTFILAPLVNLRSVKGSRAKLLAFPLKVKDAPSAPVRAAIVEE